MNEPFLDRVCKNKQQQQLQQQQKTNDVGVLTASSATRTCRSQCYWNASGTIKIKL